MNERTRRKVERLLDRLDRDARRPRRPLLPLPALYVALGLVVGYQLLVRFVLLVWGALLPDGLARAETLQGSAGLLWRLSLFCLAHYEQVFLALCGVAITVFVLARGPRPARLLAWLAAIAVVGIDIIIVVVTMKTALEATLQGSPFS